MRGSSLLFILLTLLAAIAGCVRDRVHDSAEGEAKSAMIAPRAVIMTRGDGSAAAWEQMIADAAAADVVLIGETHGHPVGLASAAALWEDVLARDPKAALALEFLERDEQPYIDDYLAGLTDEKAFREAARLTAGNYPAGHAAMLEGAKAAKRPVIAANAPRVYVRAARRDGYERLSRLSPEQRRLFRIPDELPTGRYRQDFDKIMGGMGSHTAPPPAAGKPGAAPQAPEETPEQKQARLDASFRSQSLWDWTMAESVVRTMDAGSAGGAEGSARPVVLVVGRFHVEFDGGLAQAIRKMRPGTKIVSVVYVDGDRDMGSMKEEDRGRADYVMYVGPAKQDQESK